MNPELLIELLLDEEFDVEPTLEEELAREKQIHEIRQCKNATYIKNLCIDLIRQNHSQTTFIASCLEKLAYLHSLKLIEEEKTKKKKNNKKWWQKSKP
tara:strand:- start:250 stop:543 length:294 start_codon:yes stop_codon:yes gene_type:complete